MINVKKGPAHSLGQADVRGIATQGLALGGATAATTGVSVVAGNVCYLSGVKAPGYIVLGTPRTTNDTGIIGLAINNSTDGDAIESNKIALYTLDGASIIETDQVDATINATNFPIGKAVYAWAAGESYAGKVTATSSGNVTGPIGWVEGIRSLQNVANSSSVTAPGQGYISLPEENAGTPATLYYNYSGQFNINVLSIKLASMTGVSAN